MTPTTDSTLCGLVTSDTVIAALVPHLPIPTGQLIQRLVIDASVESWTTMLQWQTGSEVGTLFLTGLASQQIWWERLRAVVALPGLLQRCQVTLVPGTVPVWTLETLGEAVHAD